MTSGPGRGTSDGSHADGDRSRHTNGVHCRASAGYLLLKGAFDRIAAAILLLFLFIPMLLIAFWIRRDSPGRALFKQRRAGRGGMPFEFYKFRTMRLDADPYGNSPQSGDDPRITRSGRWLRETSLDELPQLINVLRGEMSLVGPRPLYVQQIAEWNERQRARLLVKPGLTAGLAQISGRGGLTLEQKLECDVRYVETIGPGFDLWILWRTAVGLIWRKGIYEVRYSEKAERRSEERGPEERR